MAATTQARLLVMTFAYNQSEGPCAQAAYVFPVRVRLGPAFWKSDPVRRRCRVCLGVFLAGLLGSFAIRGALCVRFWGFAFLSSVHGLPAVFPLLAFVLALRHNLRGERKRQIQKGEQGERRRGAQQHLQGRPTQKVNLRQGSPRRPS